MLHAVGAEPRLVQALLERDNSFHCMIHKDARGDNKLVYMLPRAVIHAAASAAG
jgi:hypothetical protein